MSRAHSLFFEIQHSHSSPLHFTIHCCLAECVINFSHTALTAKKIDYAMSAGDEEKNNEKIEKEEAINMQTRNPKNRKFVSVFLHFTQCPNPIIMAVKRSKREKWKECETVK